MTCGCVDEFSDPRFCGRCNNPAGAGKPLPPYRPVTEGEEEVGALPPFQADVGSRSSLIDIAGAGFTCVCGREVIAGDDVWRGQSTEQWRGLACCPRPMFVRDPELAIHD